MITLNVTADDLGYCKGRNAGIIELAKSGFIQKTSLLVNAVDTFDAVSAVENLGRAERHPDDENDHNNSTTKVGLHLNLTEGKPIVKEKTSLVNDTGYFLGKFGFRKEISRGAICHNDIRNEVIAQIEYFKELLGYFPPYIDGHQHIHVLPTVRDSFADVLSLFGIKETRLPIELDLNQCEWISEQQSTFLQSVCKDSEDAATVFKQHQIRYPDFFIGLSTMGKTMTSNSLSRAFERILKRIKQDDRHAIGKERYDVEFMVHPGYPSMAGCGGCGQGPDEFSTSIERHHELDFIKNKLSGLCSRFGIHYLFSNIFQT